MELSTNLTKKSVFSRWTEAGRRRRQRRRWPERWNTKKLLQFFATKIIIIKSYISTTRSLEINENVTKKLGGKKNEAYSLLFSFFRAHERSTIVRENSLSPLYFNH